MMQRSLLFLSLLLVGLTVSSGWAQPAQPEPRQAPAPGMPGMMMPMMPMMGGDMTQMMQFCAQMMNQMAGTMGAQQQPPPSPPPSR